jgi:hypothetical protein
MAITKKKPARRRAKRAKPAAARKQRKPIDWQPGGIDHAIAHDLPHPDLPPVSERHEEEDPNSAPPKSGFLASLSSGLKNLVSPPVADSSAGSATPSETSSELPPETEVELAAVPDVIGPEPGAMGAESAAATQAAPAGGEHLSADTFSSLLDAIAFEEQDVQDTLGEIFDYLAERFESDHWKLTERQMRMLGRPTAQLLNSIWTKLRTRIPDILAKWCEDTPGATAFCLAFGLVVVPKVTKQFVLSRQPRVEKVAAPPRKQPAAVSVPGTMGIPVATGVIGER